jgi:hypothetical protein
MLVLGHREADDRPFTGAEDRPRSGDLIDRTLDGQGQRELSDPEQATVVSANGRRERSRVDSQLNWRLTSVRYRESEKMQPRARHHVWESPGADACFARERAPGNARERCPNIAVR